jgi:pimeloyl-ACP methyl ester carboxylesterase
MALENDPIRVDWRFQNQYDNIDPSLITIPVLVLQEELDPLSPTERQTKLFTRLNTADISWVVISGGDHAPFQNHIIDYLTAFLDKFNE